MNNLDVLTLHRDISGSVLPEFEPEVNPPIAQGS